MSILSGLSKLSYLNSNAENSTGLLNKLLTCLKLFAALVLITIFFWTDFFFLLQKCQFEQIIPAEGEMLMNFSFCKRVFLKTIKAFCRSQNDWRQRLAVSKQNWASIYSHKLNNVLSMPLSSFLNKLKTLSLSFGCYIIKLCYLILYSIS